jgi:hypothetical protein
LCQIASHRHVAPENSRDPGAAEIPQYKPQLQRPEPPAQRQAVFGEIDRAILLDGMEIGRRLFQRKHAPHDILFTGKENAEVHRSEEPLVRINHHRIGLCRPI